MKFIALSLLFHLNQEWTRLAWASQTLSRITSFLWNALNARITFGPSTALSAWAPWRLASALPVQRDSTSSCFSHQQRRPWSSTLCDPRCELRCIGKNAYLKAVWLTELLTPCILRYSFQLFPFELNALLVHCLLSLDLFLGREHATLYFTKSVGRSVGPTSLCSL